MIFLSYIEKGIYLSFHWLSIINAFLFLIFCVSYFYYVIFSGIMTNYNKKNKTISNTLGHIITIAIVLSFVLFGLVIIRTM